MAKRERFISLLLPGLKVNFSVITFLPTISVTSISVALSFSPLKLMRTIPLVGFGATLKLWIVLPVLMLSFWLIR